MTVELIKEAEQFFNLQEEWNRLLESSGIKSPFLSWEWQFTWWETYRAQLSEAELCIAVVREENKLQAVLPLYRSRTGGLRVLRFIGDPLESSDYLRLICEPSQELHFLELLIDRLIKSEPAADMMHLSNILEQDSFIAQLQETVKKKGLSLYRRHHRICPYISVQGGWDDFVNRLSKNMRYNLRRRTRKLFNGFRAKFIVETRPDEVEALIDQLFSLHKKRWDTREGETIFKADTRLEFHRTLAGRFYENGMLKLFRIKIGEDIVAILYCYEFAGELMYFQAGFDPAWEKHSVGLVLMGKCIEYAFNNGLTRFDFMRGAEDYKFRWTKQVRNMDEVYIGISEKGKRYLRKQDFIYRAREGVKRFIPERRWEQMKKLLGKA